MKIMFFGAEKSTYSQQTVTALERWLVSLEEETEFLYGGRNRFELLAAIRAKRYCGCRMHATLVATHPQQVWDELLYDRIICPLHDTLTTGKYVVKSDDEEPLPEQADDALREQRDLWMLSQVDLLCCYAPYEDAKTNRLCRLAEQLQKTVVEIF